MNYELIHREEIEGSPFHVIGNKDKGYFIAIGAYRITETEPTVELAKELLQTHMWDIVMKLVITTNTIIKDMDAEQMKNEVIEGYKKNHPEVKVVKV